jgi:mannose/cellobiose epimerase-like protein (N-acyl-D-glucosamine 2-epimerase family)
VHPLFALAQAYSVVPDRRYLAAAEKQYRFLKKNFTDEWYPGAFLPSRTRDLQIREGTNNSDVFTHWLEALLALYDVAAGDLRSRLASDIGASGDFLVRKLYRNEDGRTDRGYVAYYYTDGWEPSHMRFDAKNQWTGAGYATPGHGIELAFLLSRAVEQGLGNAEEWIGCGEKMIAFCEAHAFDGKTGAMLYDICAYDGRPLARENGYVYWPQCESARALLHYAVVRGKSEYLARFKKVESFIMGVQTDRELGGLWSRVEKDLSVPYSYKGDIWKTNYHFNMFVSEVIRLAENYPAKVAALPRP